MGREQRDALLDPAAKQSFAAMERDLRQPGYAAMQIDKQTSAIWLAARLNRPEAEVQSNFDHYASNYFGRAITPGGVYDEIVKYEQDQAALLTTPPPAQAGGQEAATNADAPAKKGFQFVRTLGAAFEMGGQDTAAGTFSMIEGALNTMGGTPKRKSAFDDPAFLDSYEQLRGLEKRGLGETPEAERLRTQTSAAVKAADADFLARKEEFENGTIRGAMSSTARQHADFFFELSSTAMDRYGVDEAYRESMFGKAAEMTGQMIGTSALMAAGSLTTAAKLGKLATMGQRVAQAAVKVAVNTAGTGQIYAGVTREREEFLGEGYANEGWSFAQDITDAGVQQAFEMIPFLDNAFEKAFRSAPKVNGRVSLGDALRRFPTIAAKSGGVEAAEEIAQGTWHDFIVDQGYDDERVDISDGKLDWAKRRATEALAGFAGGVMMAGIIQGPLIYDQNNRAKKAERMLTAKDGGLYSARDFQLLREARSDEEISGMAMGDVLLKAVNGDVVAMQQYNKEAAKQAFKQVDGMELVNGKLGEVDGKPAFLDDKGDIYLFDLTDAKQAAQWDKVKDLAVRWNEKKAMEGVQGEQATSDMVSYITQLQTERGGLFTIDVGVKARSILEQVGGNEKKAQKLVDNYIKAGALPEGSTINSIVQGGSSTKFDEKTRKFVTAIQIAQGANPLVVLEESAHDYFKRQIKLGNFSEATVNDWRRQVEAGWEGNMDYTELHEWLAKYAVGYAMGKVQAGEISTLPSSFRRYLDRFAQFFRESLEFAAKVMQMEKDNVLPADFLLALQEATGLDRARFDRNRRGMELESVFAQLPPEAQMVAEAAQQALLDFEKLKNEYRQQEALQMQAAINADRQADAAIAQGLEERMRALDFARARAEAAIDEAMNLPASTQLSAQAQAALDEWESYSLSSLNDTGDQNVGDMTFNLFPIHDTIIKALVAEEGTIQKVETDPLEGGKVRSIAKFFQGTAKANERIDWQKNWRGTKRTFPKGQEQKFQKDVDRAATRMVEVLRIAKAIFPNFQSWYESRLKMAMDIFAELDQDAKKPEHNFILRSLLAITSNGNKVNDQTSDSWRIYKEWKKVGKLDNSESISGTRSGEIRKALSRLDDLIEDNGWEKVDTFLKSTGTVAELRDKLVSDFGFTEKEAKKATTGELVDEVVPFSLIFGPKLGSFFNNLSGNFNTTTMDRWFMRTFGRALGYQLTKIEKEDVAEKRKRLEVALENAAKTKEGISVLRAAGLRANSSPSNSTTIALNDYFVSSENREGIVEDSPVDELRKAANGLFKIADGFELEEAPQSGGHRRFIRLAMEKARATFSTETNLNWNAAELQAILWYFEKLVHDTYGSKQTDSTPDYGSAANKLFQGERGGADAVAFKPSDAIQRGTGERGRLEQLARTSETSFNLAPTDPTLWDSGTQEITSAKTSINQSKMPATFSRVEFAPGTRNADIGGGSFDNATEYLKGKDVENVIFDPFNRTKEANDAAVAKIRDGQSDTATVNNVLNVIQEPDQRSQVIAQAANAIKPDGTAYFLIYEGNADGAGKKTKIGTWQENRKAADYIDEIGQYFSDVKKAGNLLVATGPQTDTTMNEERAVPADESNVVVMPDGARLVGPTTFSIRAFHGTPHKVGKFSLDKIGTGEGAQAYGWGLYFAKSKDVAMKYEPRNDKQEAAMMAEYKKSEAREDYVAMEIWESAMLHKLPVELVDTYTEANGFDPEYIPKAKAIADKVSAILKKTGGALYTVELLPNEDEFLDWDKPLSEQSEKVKAALAAFDPTMLGQQVYADVTQKNVVPRVERGVEILNYDSAQEQASRFLASRGIPGIRYLDAGSRSTGEGTSNYVIFDENLIKILEENGQPVSNESKMAGQQTFAMTPGTPSQPAMRRESPEMVAIRQEVDAIMASQQLRNWQNLGIADVANMQAVTYVARVKAAQDAQKAVMSGDVVDQMDRVLMTYTSAMDRLVAGLGSALQRLTFAKQRNAAKDKTVILALAEKIKALPNANEVFLQFQVMGRADNRAGVEGLAKLYGFTAELAAAEYTLAQIRRDSIEAGVPVSRYWSQPDDWTATDAYRKDIEAAKRVQRGRVGEAIERVLVANGFTQNIDFYWPSKVFDKEGLDKWFGTNKDARVVEAYRTVEAAAIKAGRSMTEEDLVGLISTMVNGGRRGKAGPGSLKQRTIANEAINIEVMQFYYNAIEAALLHVESMRTHIQQLDFFGKSVQLDERNDTGSGVPPIDLAQSARVLFATQAAGNQISPAKEEALTKLIVSRFEPNPGNRVVNVIRALGYVMSLGQVYSGQTATLDALAIGLREDHLNPLNTFLALIQAATGKSTITLAEAGIDTFDMGEDFQSTQKWEDKMVRWVFKHNLLTQFSRLYAQAGLNQALKAAQRQARSGDMDAVKQKRLERLFGTDGMVQVMADLAAGRKTDDTLLYAFATVANYQPISPDQQSQFMRSSSTGKIIFQFKSFLTVQISGMRDDAYNEIRSGDPKRVLNGTRFLLALAATLLMVGLPGDLLRSWLTGRTFILSDQVAARLLGLIGLSPYLVREGKRSGPSKVIASLLIPSVGGAVDDLVKDVFEWEAVMTSRADVSYLSVIQNMRVWQNAPLLGKIYDDRYGYNSTRNEKNREDIGWFVLTDPTAGDKAEQKNEATRKRLEEKYSNE